MKNNSHKALGVNESQRTPGRGPGTEKHRNSGVVVLPSDRHASVVLAMSNVGPVLIPNEGRDAME